MPQLNPEPWFALLVYSWLIFGTIVPVKVKAFLYPNEPNYEKDSLDILSWSWPWY
nr:ATP synthase F0 subunit 8 [Cociella crocodilus]